MGGRLRFPNPLHARSFQAPKQNPTGGPSNRRGSGARYKQGASEPTRTLPPVSVGVSSISDSDQSHLLFVDVLSSELKRR